MMQARWHQGPVIRHWLPAMAACMLVLAPLRAAPRSSQAPRAAQASGVITVDGDTYLDVREFGRAFGLSASWVEKGKRMRLKSQWTTIELDAEQRDFRFNGLQLFLGDPVHGGNGTLYASKTDIDLLLAPILAPKTSAGRPPPAVRTIVIDPGHGGADTGTRNTKFKLNEKTMTLDVARRLEGLLTSRGYRVILTRTSDKRLAEDQLSDLIARADFANQHGADLFISIHFNAVTDAPRVHGTETYLLTRAGQFSTSGSHHTSSEEKSLPGNRQDAWNAVLAYGMHQQLIGDLGTFDRGMKFARFKVLTLVDCPGILVESGYLSNDAEAARIGTAEYRQKIANSIADGVKAYAEQVDRARAH